MSDAAGRGFLEHIIAHPDDDSPRLVYADWLEEHGDPDRAEFIRAQIERAKLPAWEARAVRLRIREWVLQKRHDARWRAELPFIKVKGIMWGRFRRGFMAEVSFASFASFKSGIDACRRVTPLEAVSVRWPGRRDDSEQVPPVPGLRELSMSGWVVDLADVGRLAASPWLSTLRALNLRGCNLNNPEAFRQLLASPHLHGLTALRVPFNSLGDAGVAALVAADPGPVEELDMSEQGEYGYAEDPVITPAGMRELAAWPGLERVRSLSLAGNAIDGDGLHALLSSPRAAGLKTLSVRNNRFDEWADGFAHATAGLRLDGLDFGENALWDGLSDDLFTARCLGELKVLKLDRCNHAASRLRDSDNSPLLASLRHLNVNHDRFYLDDVRVFLGKLPPHLHTLQMADNHAGDDGVAYLARSPASDGLVCLDLALNELGDPAAGALARSPHLRDLQALWLANHEFSQRAMTTLKQSPLGTRLAILDTARGSSSDLLG